MSRFQHEPALSGGWKPLKGTKGLEPGTASQSLRENLGFTLPLAQRSDLRRICTRPAKALFWILSERATPLRSVVPWEHFVEARDLLVGDASVHPCQPCLRVDRFKIGGFDQGVGEISVALHGRRSGLICDFQSAAEDVLRVGGSLARSSRIPGVRTSGILKA